MAIKTTFTKDGKVIIEGWAPGEDVKRGFPRIVKQKTREMAIVQIRSDHSKLFTKDPAFIRVTIERIK